jgi:hypothetical protein
LTNLFQFHYFWSLIFPLSINFRFFQNLQAFQEILLHFEKLRDCHSIFDLFNIFLLKILLTNSWSLLRCTSKSHFGTYNLSKSDLDLKLPHFKRACSQKMIEIVYIFFFNLARECHWVYGQASERGIHIMFRQNNNGPERHLKLVIKSVHYIKNILLW